MIFSPDKDLLDDLCYAVYKKRLIDDVGKNYTMKDTAIRRNSNIYRPVIAATLEEIYSRQLKGPVVIGDYVESGLEKAKKAQK